MTLSFILSLALPMIRGLVKNEKRKRQFRNILLEVKQAIETVYADDSAFQ